MNLNINSFINGYKQIIYWIPELQLRWENTP